MSHSAAHLTQQPHRVVVPQEVQRVQRPNSSESKRNNSCQAACEEGDICSYLCSGHAVLEFESTPSEVYKDSRVWGPLTI